MRLAVIVLTMKCYVRGFVAHSARQLGASTQSCRTSRRKFLQHPKAMMSDVKEDGYPFSAMDIRVGTFINAWYHPDSDKLFVEEIDLGEEEPRQIVSGLRAHYTLDQLDGQRCLVVVNLPKAKLAGVNSYGMVLCGSEAEKAKVEFIVPPEGSENGDRVLCGEDDSPAMTANQVKKKKIWNDIQPRLAVIDGVATFDGKPLATSDGPCRTSTIQAGPIS